MPTRRQTIRTIMAGAAAATIPLANAEAPELTMEDPIAVALDYNPIAENVDTKAFPQRATAEGAKQYCNNCALYSGEPEGLGTCTAVPGKLVAGKGWCRAWVPVRAS